MSTRHPSAPPLPEPAILAALGAPLTGLTADSRHIAPGSIFAAYPGEHRDGRDFIPQAIAAGASAILWESEHFSWRPEWHVANLAIPGLKRQLGPLAAQAFGHPSQALWTIGITGTNGKTSCSHWLAQSFSRLGRRCAIIGTLGNGFAETLSPAHNTTPDAIAAQRLLASFREAGARAVAMEVSSHGLAQGRVNGIEFDLALFTNLSRDHLDYHGNMEAYGAAKRLLFLSPGLSYAVVNLDDPFGQRLAEEFSPSLTVVGYGFGTADGHTRPAIQGGSLVLSATGMSFDVSSPWGCARIESSLLGRFNANNLLAVLATLLTSGVDLHEAVAILQGITPVTGRMHRLGGGERQPLVVIDYAHTPDALEKALATLREILPARARLHCVFGCGGDRDRGKRPLMGAVAARLADIAIVTSDNPRSEAPLAIIDDIAGGMGANYRVIEDRAAAIETAISAAQPGDIVLIAGKGHEDYQEIHGERLPFSDLAVASRGLGC